MKNFHWQKWILVALLSGALALLSGGVWAQAWANVGAPGFAAGAGSSLALDAAGTPYVAYVDRDNGSKISVKKFVGAAWVDVGMPVSSGMALGPSLALDAAGKPYVAYKDYDQDDRITVKRFDGDDLGWVMVGTPGFSNVANFTPSLKMAGNTPYVAYIDNSNNRVTVMSFNGATWSNVGVPSATFTASSSPSLAMNGATPYVAYINTNDKVAVMSYNGANWVAVGAALAEDASYAPSLAIVGGTPYVAFVDWSNHVLVRRFVAAWSNAGGNLTGETFYAPSLAADGAVPYVAYVDWNNGSKVTVMKLDGANWSMVGAPGFSAADANSPSLAISAAGIPYTSYNYWNEGGLIQRISVMRFANDAPPIYGITLDRAGLYEFPAATVGYGAQAPLPVKATNIGTAPTGLLNVALSGANMGNFTITANNVAAGLAVGGEATFNVAPNVGLAVGIYNATVTVSGSNGITASFDARFTVNALVNAQAPIIDTPPIGATYVLNDAATPLSVAAHSADGGSLTYQWYKNAANSNVGGTLIPGATGANYTPDTAATGTTYYYVVVTNTKPDATGTNTSTATSNTAMVVVLSLPTHGKGGGILNTGTLTLVNSTVTGNSSVNSLGGGIFNQAGATTTLINSTVFGNTGGDLYNDDNPANAVQLSNIIVGGCLGSAVADNGGNLSNGNTCGFNAASSRNNAVLNLGALGNNGGPTPTMLPGVGSAAIGFGVLATCANAPVSALDQRGVVRPAASCTSGAVEVVAPPPVPPTVVSVTPSGLDAEIAGNVVITFSEAMNTAVAGTVQLNALAALPAGVWSVGNTVYTVAYAALAYSTAYTVNISDFANAAGTVMVADNGHDFTTKAAAAPSGITITGQPASTTVMQGAIAGNLTVTATVVPNVGLIYYWYRNAVNSTVGGTLIPGSNNATFPIPTDLLSGTYYYYCYVVPAVPTTGVNPVFSNVARVNVILRAGPDSLQAIPALNPTVLMLLAVFTLLLGGAVIGGTGYVQKKRRRG
jgi:hypothetical protein